MTKKRSFSKWVADGLESGYIQGMDKCLREQYNITEQCTEEHWKEALEHFKASVEKEKG